MWWKIFCGCHKIVSALMWHMSFSPQEQHDAMQKPPRCECGSMQRLVFSSQEFIEQQ
jgi:hypothetical protein